PKIRQTLFFSATMAPDIKKLADKFLMNPKEISVAPPASAAETVTQGLIITEDKMKREALRALLEQESVKNALIFCNRKRDIAALESSLKRHGYDVGALHGDMSQPARMDTLARFKNNEIRLLVCSDVAARGLDISALSHVFNFDVPINAEDYIHRIGRTGRAGMEGRAFTIATPEDARAVASVEKLMGKPIPRVEATGVASSELGDPEEGGRGRGRGRRKPAAKAPARSADKAPAKPAAKAETKPEPAADSEPAEKPKRAPRRRKAAAKPDDSAADKPEAQDSAEKPAKPKAKPSADEKKPAAKPRRSPAKNDKSSDNKDDAPVGLGDHMPAFLMRPVKR
ncbi:MAG: DEAD/DEAH box helicase, partial [Rhodospirillales bacterium]